MRMDERTGLQSTELAETVTQEMLKQGFSRRYLAKNYAESIGFAQSSTSYYLSKVSRGLVYGTTGTPLCPHESLDHLSRLLFGLGIEDDHDIILHLKHIDSLFTYPPKNGVRFESPKEA